MVPAGGDHQRPAPDAVDALVAAREAAPVAAPRAARRAANALSRRELSYLANVLNTSRPAPSTGVTAWPLIADAYEANTTPGDVALMITKHCLRYSHSLCPKEAKGLGCRRQCRPMTLVNGGERLTLKFDCKKCEMHVMGRLRKPRTIAIMA